MTDNQLLEKAAMLCIKMHAGHVDKSGQAYFQHPMRVAMRCQTIEQKIVALLHDTIEDTDVTPDFLFEEGFSQTIVDAVLSVTKRGGERYEDFVGRAAENPIGRIVKLHDIEDNLDVLRLSEVDNEMAQRFTKYLHARRFLLEYQPEETTPEIVLSDISRPEHETELEQESEPEQEAVLTPTRILTQKEYWRSRRAEANKNINNASRTPKGATNYNKD